jgi:hypothetical protein
MGAIVILLVLGICVFLIWFFEAVMKDASMDDAEVVIDLRLERARGSAAQIISCEQSFVRTAGNQDPMRRAG